MQRATNSIGGYFAAAVALALFLSGLSGRAIAADDDQSRTVQGLIVDYGIVPAAILKGHPPTHVERTMHGGPTGSKMENVSPVGSQYHLVVAVFDAATGVRVTNAVVKAEIFPLNSSGSVVTLETMQIAGTTTYGGFFRAPDAHHYTIRLTIQRPSKSRTVTLVFEYDHQ